MLNHATAKLSLGLDFTSFLRSKHLCESSFCVLPAHLHADCTFHVKEDSGDLKLLSSSISTQRHSSESLLYNVPFDRLKQVYSLLILFFLFLRHAYNVPVSNTVPGGHFCLAIFKLNICI